MRKNAKTLSYTTTRRERFSYWFYFAGQNFSYMLMVMLLPAYLLLVGVDVTKAAAAIFAVKIWDAVNDTVFGVIFDKIKFKGGKKCLPWIRLSAVCMPVASLLMYLLPVSAGENMKLLWFVLSYLLWDVAYTLTDVPAFALINSMTGSVPERNNILSVARMFATYGGGASFVAGTVLVSEQVGVSFRTVALIVCAGMALAMLPLGFTARERIVPDRVKKTSYTFREILSYLRANKPLRYFFSGFLVSGVLFTSSSVELFVSYYLFGSTLFSTLMYLAAAVPMLIVAVFLPKLLRRFDKFKLFFAASAISTVIGLAAFFIGYGSITVYMILAVLRAFPFGAIAFLNLTFTPDCVEYGLYQTGIDARGMAYAVQSFVAKFNSVSQSVGIFVIGLFGFTAVKASGFAELAARNIVQPDAALGGLWVVYALLPALGGLLALIPYHQYRLNDQDVQIMAQCNAGEITRAEAAARLSCVSGEAH